MIVTLPPTPERWTPDYQRQMTAELERMLGGLAAFATLGILLAGIWRGARRPATSTSKKSRNDERPSLRPKPSVPSDVIRRGIEEGRRTFANTRAEARSGGVLSADTQSGTHNRSRRAPVWPSTGTAE